MLLEDSPAPLSLGSVREEVCCSHEWKKEESPSLIKDEHVRRCKSENRVPIVAVSEESRKPDDPSMAVCDRLHFPGVQAPGNRSHKVPEWLQPFNKGLSGEPTQCRDGTTYLELSQKRKHPMVEG